MLFTCVQSFPQFRCPVVNSGRFYELHLFYLLERSRLRVADLGVAGGGRPWLPAAAAAAEDRKVEK